MSYNTLEASQASGAPIELYLVTCANETWTFTSGDTPITYLGNVYSCTPVSRDGQAVTIDIKKASMNIKLARTHPLAVRFLPGPPDQTCSVTIFKLHRGDAADVKVIWKGRLLNTSLTGSVATLACESIQTSMKRFGLRAVYQTNCRHTLYEGVPGTGCGVDPEYYRHNGVVASIDGAIINVTGLSGFAAEYFPGGFVRFGDYQYRMIIANDSAGNLTLLSAVPGLAVGTSVAAYAGCDHLKGTCQSKFNNLLNFGGFPFIPLKNPYTGDPISS